MFSDIMVWLSKQSLAVILQNPVLKTTQFCWIFHLNISSEEEEVKLNTNEPPGALENASDSVGFRFDSNW